MKVRSYSVLVLMQTKSRSENGNWYGKSIAIFKRVLLRKHIFCAALIFNRFSILKADHY